MARRIPRLSTTFRRTLAAIGVRPNTAPYRAVFAAVGALGDAEALPGLGDYETRFAPGRAHVRRVRARTFGCSIGSMLITCS